MSSREWFYPTAFDQWGEEERDAIARVCCSGRFTQGEEVAAFEAEFAAFHGKRHAIMVNSGSSANLVAVSALCHLGKLKEGDKAIVPAIAWSTTYAPLAQHGIELVLADVEPETWNANPYGPQLDVDGVTLVVACSVLGAPASIHGWSTIAGTIGATLIEDNCESAGASISLGNDETAYCGTFGLMGTFSLFWSHQISAIEGGVIVTDDDECADLCRMLRAHGWTRDTGLGGSRFEDEYDFRAFGYNVRGLELHAAVAREQLRKLPAATARRNENAELFRMLTAELPIWQQQSHGQPSPFGVAFAMDAASRPHLVERLRAAGIDCRLPTGGSFRRHQYARQWAGQKTPAADVIHDGGLFLGNAGFNISPQVERAAHIIRKFYSP